MNLGGENNEGGFTSEQDTHFTACKTSLFFAGDGFNVYDNHGKLVFRVDSYGRPDWGENIELVLMDASGRCLLTVRRKWASLHNRWEGYRGERSDRSKPIFSVKRSSIIGRSEVTVEIYESEGEEYKIDGSFADRSCTIYDATTREVMAEIRRKVDISSNVLVGKDAFSLHIKPGFDSAFAMGLVIVLDQINADAFEDGLPDDYDDGPSDGFVDRLLVVPAERAIPPVGLAGGGLPIRVVDVLAVSGGEVSKGFLVDPTSPTAAH